MKKAEIMQIGTIDENGQPHGWAFDCNGDPTKLGINTQEDGSTIYAGWTVEELRSITRLN